MKYHNITKADMLKYAKHLFISDEIGFAKPAKEYFEECMKRLAPIKKEEVIQEDTVSGDITVKFVDVGQGDACIIMTPNDDVIVIDTGDNKDADEVLEELRKEEFEDMIGGEIVEEEPKEDEENSDEDFYNEGSQDFGDNTSESEGYEDFGEGYSDEDIV